jgi:GNAT superfamily N-acetyltransferase
MSRREVLSDGQPVLIRPLLYGDRFELAAGFTELSPRSRRHRFFNAPDELDDDELEYLTNLDYHDHFACAAVLEDGPAPRGVGVARYVREGHDPTVAEVAVTVLDAYQRRGIGTLLTRTLAEVAAGNGIRSFVNYVQWENAAAIELLTDEESRITPAEPGVARIEVELPARPAEVPDSHLHRVISAYAARVRELGHLFEADPAPSQGVAGSAKSWRGAVRGRSADTEDGTFGRRRAPVGPALATHTSSMAVAPGGRAWLGSQPPARDRPRLVPAGDYDAGPGRGLDHEPARRPDRQRGAAR